MTEMVFEPLTSDEWTEEGAGASAEKGEYLKILTAFNESGQRYAVIRTDKEHNGRFAGRKASSISTALKNARDSKNAPESVSQVKVSSKKGNVYLENEAVAA